MEIALASLCGPKDIITRITREDEEARQKLGYRGEQNIYLPPWRYKWNDWGTLINKRSLKKYYNHMSVKELLQLIPRSIWDEYFTFSFERNPWDKVISDYYWTKSDERYGSIKEYLKKGPAGRLGAYDIYSLNNLPAVDKMYRMENMKEALIDISNRLNLPEPLTLPSYRAKSASRKDKRHYREVLSDEEREMISMMFAREIKLMGYTY